MFNPSAALFANTMLMFRLMFFHIKNRRSGFYHAAMSFFRHISGRFTLNQCLSKKLRHCVVAVCHQKEKTRIMRVSHYNLSNTLLRAIAHRNRERMTLSRMTHYPIDTNRVAKNNFARLPAFTTGSHCHISKSLHTCKPIQIANCWEIR